MKSEEINKDKENNINENNNNKENEINISENEENNENYTTEINKYQAEILNVPQDYTDYEINFKIIIIGKCGVGKTCITNLATKQIFNDNYVPTIGMEIFSLFIKLNNKTLKLQIWDTCGQEIYRSLITNFYRSSSLAILVYSIDQKDSFTDLDLWLKELKLYNSPDTNLILVGNKKDLDEQREVTYEEGKKFADDFGFIDFFETSAKTGENIKNMFIRASIKLYENHLKYKDQESVSSFGTFKPSISLKSSKSKKNRRKKCC